MPEIKQSLSESYFDDVYRNSEDPWNFETSLYEAEKYKETIAALPGPIYENAFEIGCSIGVLSKMLAGKCRHLLSADAAEAPLVKARQRLKELDNVTVEKRMMPAGFPDQMFDLVVMSEVGYYLSEEDLGKLRQQITDHTVAGAHVLLVHWTPFVPDYPLTGDEVHRFFLEETAVDKPFRHVKGHCAEKYRLDLLEKR